MDITILGRPISKKNSRRNFGKVSLPSIGFVKFEELALKQLKDLNIKQCIKGNIMVYYKFFMKGKLDSDCDNMMAGINDILQKAEIIENDKYVTEGWFKKIAGNDAWRTEITIEKI